ncbi:IclR family transcriptional regulator domain-containing protein [Microbacterium gorillae]|uniref:IclR family transcriptional regulator domain-containing protein n=1 Tax=Microbacterium gorillae TaxID=1231063 RepID=UPI00058BBFBF|nr:IclR family transcriptional regulator C-terminal domain-containing protein [Microbacterium gorillae]
MSENESAGGTVQSLVRGLAVLRAFDGPEALSAADVARRAEIPRAAAARFLRTLAELGYVRADANGRFQLTPRVLEFGNGYLSGLSLPEIVQPHLDDLSHRVGESASVAVLDGADIVYVARAAARRIMSVHITIGTRLPAYATSMGRVLLAALSPDEAQSVLRATPAAPLTDLTTVDPGDLVRILAETRTNGFAEVEGELEEGVRSFAVPLHGRAGTVAALNVSMSTARGTQAEARERLLPELRITAAAIDAELVASGV